jgi:hypothetical protein
MPALAVALFCRKTALRFFMAFSMIAFVFFLLLSSDLWMRYLNGTK